MRWARKCEKCQKWTREAMFLIRQETMCGECGKKEILRWNEIIHQDLQPCSVALAAVGGDGSAAEMVRSASGADFMTERS